MILSMPSTVRPQQRYDHRLRDLVYRTGDVTLARDLGVPRSTARGWLGAPATVVSLDVAVRTRRNSGRRSSCSGDASRSSRHGFGSSSPYNEPPDSPYRASGCQTAAPSRRSCAPSITPARAFRCGRSCGSFGCRRVGGGSRKLDLRDTLGVVSFPPTSRPCHVLSVSRGRCTVVPQPSSPSAGGPRASSPTWCSPAFREAAQIDVVGSALLGLAVPRLARLAISTRHRQTRHRYRLASRRLPAILDVEDPPRSTRTATRTEGGSRADPANEPRESALGRAAHSRPAAQAWPRRG